MRKVLVFNLLQFSEFFNKETPVPTAGNYNFICGKLRFPKQETETGRSVTIYDKLSTGYLYRQMI